jgi:hypothetical protein
MLTVASCACAARFLAQRSRAVTIWAPQLRRGGEVRVHEQTLAWQDIGDLRGYARANWDWLGLRGLKSWVASSANVSVGAELRSAVVGAGACIETQGTLERVIVWPHARVERPLSDAVVMDNGDIVPLPDATK